MNKFFGGFAEGQKPSGVDRRTISVPAKAAGLRPLVRQAGQPGYPHKGVYANGDLIGRKYEVREILGQGGFGLAYLVFNREWNGLNVLKTFRDEFLGDPAVREALRMETMPWVALEGPPFILAAEWVEEVPDRPFLQTDYVAPDGRGRVSLDDHLLQASGLLDVGHILTWAVQFCLGMEYANAHGIKCHRDIKPGNILIAQDGTLKITDFGLAAAAETIWRRLVGQGGALITVGSDGRFGLSLFQTEGKNYCGTPGYMAPELYRGGGAGVRSDIYSFGLVLWQMATRSPTPPFHVSVPHREDNQRHLAQYMEAVYQKQVAGRVPSVEGPLLPVVERCLAVEPANRYGNFGQLRKDLEVLYRQQTGKMVEVRSGDEKTAAFWNGKAAGFHCLGRHQEAIACLDKVLAIAPRDASAWNNKGNSLHSIGQCQEAIACMDKALEIDPRNASAWSNKGNSLKSLGRHREAIACYDKALEITPLDGAAWFSKGNSHHSLGRYREAIVCYDKALEINPRDVAACNNKGNSLNSLGRYQEAIASLGKTLEIDQRYVYAWNNKGNSLSSLGRYQEAIACYDNALEIDPRNAAAWNNKAVAEEDLGQKLKAVECYRRFIALSPPAYGQYIAMAHKRLKELET